MEVGLENSVTTISKDRMLISDPMFMAIQLRQH